MNALELLVGGFLVEELVLGLDRAGLESLDRSKPGKALRLLGFSCKRVMTRV